MKISLLISCLFIFFLPLGKASAQNETLFNDKIVSSVYVSLDPDSVFWLLSNPLSDKYLKAQMVFSDGSATDSISDIGFRLRGFTSRFAMKKSFKISFQAFTPGRKYQGVKKWNLIGQFQDPSMIREKLFYDVWNQCGMPQRRSSFVKLYINEVYFGLYTGLEDLDKVWLTRNFPDNSGNLYKCSFPADLDYLGNDQQPYKDLDSQSETSERAYQLQTNESEDDYSGFVQLVSTLHNANGVGSIGQLNQIVNTDMFLKALAIDVATGNGDDYAYLKNNYFLYHNPASGQFDFITYDANNTFGMDQLSVDWSTRDCSTWIADSTQPRPLASKLLEIPLFKNRFYQFLDSVTRFVVDTASIFPHIDSIKTLITEAAEADTFRTLDFGFTIAAFHGSFDNEGPVPYDPFAIKPFLRRRSATTINQLNTILSNKSPILSGEDLAFPNPVNKELTLRQIHGQSIFLYDAKGKLLVTHDPTKGKRLDVSSLHAGLYVLRIQIGNEWKMQKINKE
jgi:hypothetical protein